MPLQSNVWFGAVPPASVPTPAAGYYALFVTDGSSSTIPGTLYTKDSTGTVSIAQDTANDFTNAKAQDAVGGALQNSDTISLTYNTSGHFITANVVANSINSTHLLDAGVSGAKIADAAIVPAKLADLAVTTVKLADIAVTASKIADGAVSTTKIADTGVTNIKLASMAAATFKMRALGTGNGQPIDGSAAQAKAALAIQASDVSGLGTAATTNATAYDPVGSAAAAQAASQPLDSDLTALAALSTTAYGRALLALADATALTALPNTASQTLKGLLSATDKTKLDNLGTASTMNSTAFDAAGAATAAQAAAIAASQPLDSDLTALAALTTTAFGRSLLALADATALTALPNTVTQTLKGLMSAADKIKVDNLGTASTMNSTAFDTAGAATAAQAASQPLDADLTAIAALATTSYGRALLTQADATALTTLPNTASQTLKGLLSATDKTKLDNLGTASTMNATAFEVAGAAATAQAAAIAASQPLDADLTAIAALATTAYGRSLLTLADAAAQTAGLNAATTTLKGLLSTADKTRLDNLSSGIYNVLDYGIAPGNTPAANVTAWNALMGTIVDNATVWFPPGPTVYQFAGTLAIPAGKHLRIAGSSNQKSILQTTSATADMFTVGDWYNEFAGLKFTTSVTRTAGAGINTGNNVAICVYDCDFLAMWDGIVYTGGVNAGNLAVVFNCGFTGTLNRGIVLDGTNANTIIDKVVMDGTLGVQQVGLELLQCGSVLVSNSDLIRAANNLRFNPTTPNGVFSAYFSNVFFDTSSASSVKFQGSGNIQRVKFTNCWFSGSVTGCEFASTAATLPTAIDFINCDIFGNTSRGIYANGVQDFNITNCRIAGNTTAGIETVASAGSVTKFNLANNSICPTAGFGANGTGILINAGTYGGYAIKNNDLRNNTTNNLTDSGSVATTDLKIINDNFGHLITGSIGNLATTASVGSLSEGVLLSARVPAKAATAGQVFRFKVLGNASAATTLVFRVRVGTAGTTGDTQCWISVTSASIGTNNRAGFDGLLTVRAAGAGGTVQCEAIGFAAAVLLPTVVAAPATVTVNTTNPWFITVTATTAIGGGYVAQNAVVEAL